MSLLCIKTIGVYGSTEDSFFKSLLDAKVDVFCDIRQRRGVRGSKYAYVNSTYLQKKLHTIGIGYVHIKELAPSSELRKKQKIDDIHSGTLKRNRETLSKTFIEGYKEENLQYFPIKRLINGLPDNAKNICLFCVEQKPIACHRSLAAEFLSERLKIPVENLTP